MVSRGNVSEDVAYVLLDTPLVPRLDLTDCRPTELPVLPEATPTQLSDHVPPGSGGRKAGGGEGGGGGGGSGRMLLATGDEKELMPLLPSSPHAPGVLKTQVPPATEVRTLVVDMRDLDKLSPHSTIDDNDDSSDEIVLDGPAPSRSGKRVGGVLKGGGDYVSSGEQRPRPRVSFLLDAAPGEGREGESMQIRVYAKPLKIPQAESSEVTEDLTSQPVSQSGATHHHTPVHHHRFSHTQHGDPAPVTGLPPKRFRPHGSADRRHSASSYRHQIRQMQVEAKLHEAFTAAARSAEGGYRLRNLHEDSLTSTYTPQLPSVSQNNGSLSSRRVPLFSFKRKASADQVLVSSQVHTQREERHRRTFVLPPNAGGRLIKGQVRFQDDPQHHSPEKADRDEFSDLHTRHAEPRSVNQGAVPNVGTYSIADRPPPHPTSSSGKPPIPRPHHSRVSSSTSVEAAPGGAGHTRVTSAHSRSSGRVREWLSVDTVPSYKGRPRPSTVSSASSSIRSRDLQQRLSGGSSRVSSASLKAASDPGMDLDNMDLATLNMMARRCKGPSRYRYLAKLRNLV